MPKHPHTRAERRAIRARIIAHAVRQIEAIGTTRPELAAAARAALAAAATYGTGPVYVGRASLDTAALERFLPDLD